jgi:hypothetical protein
MDSIINTTRNNQMVQAENGTAVIGDVVISPLENLILRHLSEAGFQSSMDIYENFSEISTVALVMTAVERLISASQPLVALKANKAGHRPKVKQYGLTSYAADKLAEQRLLENIS